MLQRVLAIYNQKKGKVKKEYNTENGEKIYNSFLYGVYKIIFSICKIS